MLGAIDAMKFSTIVRTLEERSGSNRLACDISTNPEISGLAPIETATGGTLSYVEGGKFAAWVAKTTASALVLPTDPNLQAQASARNIAWVADREPRLLFARAIALFYQPFRPAPGIHPTASIAPDSRLGRNVSIGAGVAIQAGVEIGDETCLHPNVTIYPEQRSARGLLSTPTAPSASAVKLAMTARSIAARPSAVKDSASCRHRLAGSRWSSRAMSS